MALLRVNTPSSVLLTTKDGVFTLSKAITAPSGGEAVTVFFSPANDRQPGVHPGGQPAENAMLSNLIGVAQAAVVAFTLPV